MFTRVKICGITRLEDARLAVELGASALGFNFYRPSPRYISPAAASAIIRELPPFVTAVGVFADETDAAEIMRRAEAADVNAVQLHGPRFPEAGRGIDGGRLGPYPVILAVPVDEGFQVASLASLEASAWLLDAYDPVRIGGSGKTIDWSIAREAGRCGPVILAGGLTSENVRQAIYEARPFAVDVASGVESAPGIKSVEKLHTFLGAVHGVDSSLSRSQEPAEAREKNARNQGTNPIEPLESVGP